MARALTVRELINELRHFDQDAIVVICDEGKDHYNYLTDDAISYVDNPYFPGLEPENIEYDDADDEIVTNFIQIGSI